MKLLLVDDSEAARKGLRTAIELKTTFEVVGEAQNGAEAVALADELEVDVVLMDVRMPVMDGIEATAEIKRRHPEVYILALSSTAEPSAVAGILRAGAAGYILKGALPEDFMSPLEATSTGHKVRPMVPLLT
ncbi:MAG: response regulator transcription factor [Actinomycetota bacterium]|nr:response regulator transcription factor [Actinomycetota bacterium]